MDKAGVIDNLTHALINLYEEGTKPKLPTDYVKKQLKATQAGQNEVITLNSKLREENRKLKEKVQYLEKTLEKLKKELNP